MDATLNAGEMIMVQLRRVAYTLAFLLLIGVMGANAADVAKIGVVDFQRILKESKAGKHAARLLRQKQDERSDNLKERREDIVKLQKYIEDTELTGDKSDRDQKKLELSIKLDDFKDADAAYGSRLKEINAKQTSKIHEDVTRLIEKIGKKGGYLLIVEKNDTLYSPGTIDITAKVIEQYDMEFKEED